MNVPQKTSPYVRNIALDLLLSLLTCFLYNIYIQAKQIEALNEMLGEPKYSFTNWALLTLCTCGLYHVYHEYRMTDDLARKVPSVSNLEPILVIVLAVIGIFPLIDAIQQAHINRYFGSDAL
jgi:hypothetical protein